MLSPRRLAVALPLLFPLPVQSSVVPAPPVTRLVEIQFVPKPLQVSPEGLETKVTPLPVPSTTLLSQIAYTAPTCLTLLQETGVTDIPNALNVLSRENRNCNVYAKNPSSTACGIGQDINGCEVGYDPIAQMRWFEDYVYRRYGTFANAWSHELSYGWY